MINNKQNKQNKLGKLSAFGIKEPWQTSLLLPEGWDDFTRPLKSFKRTILSGSSYYFRCCLDVPPKVTFKGRIPRLTAVLLDEEKNRGRLMAYGDTRFLEKELNALKESWFYLYATLDRDPETGHIWINNAEIIPPEWHNQLRPRYPGKPHIIGSGLVRDRVLDLLQEGLPQASEWLKKELSPIGTPADLMTKCGLRPTISFDKLLLRAHTPLTIKQGKLAQKCLMKLAALKLIKNAKNSQRNSIEPIAMNTIWGRLLTVGFDLTPDQKKAVVSIAADLESGLPTQRLLSGDVATGKTIVYALVAAAVADAGRITAIMLPTAGLVAQVTNNMRTWWPDLNIQSISGESTYSDITGQIIIGTTAILHRRFHNAPDFLVIDEQHKYSRNQREQLMAPHTHLLEVSATPIPRTQALLRYGMLQISRLTQRHKKSTITTRIWSKENTAELTQNIFKTLNNGQQLLVIYAKREKTDNSKLDIKDINTAYEGWSKKFPGRVRMAHGAMKDHEKKAALDAMLAGQADIMLATTIFEVGMDLPNLYHLLIVDPDRYGLVTLHQLRGRIARQGGKGSCDLLITRDLAPKTKKRLDVFCNESDGFKLAELDMRARGIGDISIDGDTQSGADESFLFGRSIDVDVLDEMIEVEG